VVRHTANTWEEVVGIVLQSAKRGRRLAVAPDMVHITGDRYAPTGQEKVSFTVFDPRKDSAASAVARPDNTRRIGALSVTMEPLPSR
jgi:hypothetical protein